jgi:lipopolysaccharide export system protein LptA
MQAIRIIQAAAIWAVMAVAAFAQGTTVPFGSLMDESGLPVEISADTLSVDQADGSAVFEGNVLVVQGNLRLSAGKLRVEYATGDNDNGTGIARLVASGEVILIADGEKAEANEATYDLAGNRVILDGEVLLATGNSAILSEHAEIDLATGKAVLEGRVRTILQTGDN